MSAELKPCPFCGRPAAVVMGFPGCEPCALVRRDADSWNRRADMQPAPATEQALFDAWADEKGLLPHARHARWDGWLAATQAERVQSSESIDTAMSVGTLVENGVLAVTVHLKQGELTTVVYGRNHSLNGTSVGTAALPASLFDARRATASKAEAPDVACNAALRAAPAMPVDAETATTETLDEQALNSLLWFYRRMINNYGRLPFAEEAITRLRARIAANTKEGGKNNG